MSFEARSRLIKNLEMECGRSLLVGTELRAWHYDPEKLLFRCDVHEKWSRRRALDARAVVLAVGRFGPGAGRHPHQLLVKYSEEWRWECAWSKRAELFLQEDQYLDPKLIVTSPDGRYGWRTFCCCRDGEVITTDVRGVVSVSGRADCSPTGRSNVGFNLRVTDADLAQALWPLGLRSLTIGQGFRVALPLDEYLAGTRRQNCPCARFRSLSPARRRAYAAPGGLPSSPRKPMPSDCPCHRGHWVYPRLADNLWCGPNPLWIAGDGTGIFRGLTAAMVSGYYAAVQAIGYTESSP